MDYSAVGDHRSPFLSISARSVHGDVYVDCSSPLPERSPRPLPSARTLPASPAHAAAPFIEKETAKSVRKVLRGLGLAPRALPSTTKDAPLEGLDFNMFASAVNLAALRPTSNLLWRLRSLKRWLLCLLIGLVTSLLATGIIFSTRRLTLLKFSTLEDHIEALGGNDSLSNVATAYLLFASLSLAFAVAGALVVAYVEPLAAGSGLPELKAYINGVNLPRLLRFKTLAAKLLGLPLAMAGGLPVGFEGPMAHIGASVAAMLSQGKSTLLGCGLALPSATFRLDSSKREFVVCGAAAGVSAAFNAPAGAVIFAIEELGASLWQKGLLWRCFFTAVTAATLLNFLLSGLQGGDWGRLTAKGMFSFGLPDSTEINGDSSWTLWELPLFALLGLLGGVSGAVFNLLSRQLMLLRIRHIAPSRALRVAEVAAVTLLVSAVAFFVPYCAGQCVSAASDDSQITAGASFFCPAGSYNDLGALFFTSPEDGIRTLFHERAGTLSVRSLGIFWVTYLSLMCLSGGIGVPSGQLIPALFAGSALGRLIGELARSVTQLPLASPGAYAVIGAASMLGGILRLSVSMTVILLEATGNTFYSLPIMVVLIVARFAGSVLSEGLYETQLEVRAWPVLEESLPKPLCYALRACDVMVSPPLVLPEVETAGAIKDLLLSCSHGGFPVVFGGGALAGYIQRRHLCVLLEQRVFHASIPQGYQQASAPAVEEGEEEDEEEKEGRGERHGAASVRQPLLPASQPLPRDPSDPRLRIRVRTTSTAQSHVMLNDMLLLGSLSPGGQHAASSSSSLNDDSEQHAPAGAAFAFPLSTASASATASRGSGSAGAAAHPVAHRPSGPSQRALSRARLATRLYASLQSTRQEEVYANEPVLEASAFSAHYPRYPDIGSVALSQAEASMYVDLRPYMDATPVTVHCQAPLERAHKLFVSMGLRHLLVVNDEYKVVGVITRRELTHARVAALADPLAE